MPSKTNRFAPTIFVLALFAFSVVISGAAQATTGIWRSSGPEGGPVLDLAVSPASSSTLFAATYQGVLKTEDGGVSWSRTATPPYGAHSFYSLDFISDGAGGYDLIAGGDLWVLRSSDGGATWSDMGDIVTPPASSVFDSVYALEASGGYPATIYSGWRLGGVIVSTDGGSTWHARNTGLPSSPTATSLLLSPGSSGTALAGLRNGGIYRTSNSGGSWQNVSPTGRSGVEVNDLTVSGGIVYAVYDTDIYYSSNFGTDWTNLYLGYNISDCAGADFDTANGIAWVACKEGPMRFRLSDLAYYGPVSTLNINKGSVFDVLIAGGKVYWASSAGVHSTPVTGTYTEAPTWSARNSGLTANVVNSVVADPENFDTVIAGTDFNETYRSLDGGDSWALARTGLTSTSYTAGANHVRGTIDLAMDPGSPSTIWAGTLEDGVFRSTNGGTSWTNMLASKTIDDVLVTSTGGVLAANGCNVYRYNGSGFDVTCVKDPSNNNGWVYAMAEDPVSHAVYAGTSNRGVFKSTSGGASWTQRGMTEEGVSDLAVDTSTDPHTIWAATDTGPYASTNDGTTWTDMNKKHLHMTNGNAIAIHEGSGGTTVFFGNHAGVFYTTDEGENWKTLGSGLGGAEVESIQVNATGDSMYVGTNGAGVKRIDFGALDSSPGTSPPPPPPADPPATSIAVSPASPNGTNGWYRTAPSITLSSTAGALYFGWASASGPWSPYSSAMYAPDGIRTIRAFAVSQGVTGDTASRTLKVDRAAPGLSFSAGSPANGSYLRGGVDIEGTATDAISGVASVRLLDGSSQKASDTTAPYVIPLDTTSLTNGSHTIRLDGYDKAGNKRSVARTYHIDNYKPRTYAPYKKSVTKGSYVRLYYRANDPYTSYVYVTVKIKTLSGATKKTLYGGWKKPGYLRYISYKASLSKGSYRFHIYAKDKAGNKQYNVARNTLTVK